MLINPAYNVRVALDMGVFTGTLSRITSKGIGVLKADSGPSPVYVRASLLNGAEVGERFRYTARWLAGPKIAVARDLRRAK